MQFDYSFNFSGVCSIPFEARKLRSSTIFEKRVEHRRIETEQSKDEQIGIIQIKKTIEQKILVHIRLKNFLIEIISFLLS